MAEVAIPLALLGGMYILSNQNNNESMSNKKQKETESKKHHEGFQSGQSLPNMNTPPQNFPINGTSELKENVQYYPSENTATDRYFQQSVYENEANQDSNTYTSLTGNQVKGKDMKHLNMQPFFGSKVKQNVNISNESRMDNMVGSGSQQFSKKEVGRLFKPEENVQWGHGMPSTTTFVQSRMNPSMSMNNVKPFQELRVGPGLNQKEGVLGSGGFNSGMEARERWISKTVDELRVKTNPKVTYGGQFLGGRREVQNRGVMGKMEKYQPDTYYINTPERYFTTTGIEKAQTARSKQMMKAENRDETTVEYFGGADQAGVEATYVPGSYAPAKRAVLDPNSKHITNAHAANKFNATDGDYGITGYHDSVTGNNRDITGRRQPQYGAVGTFAKAVIAPLMDMLRPTRKENVIGNLRPTGNAGNSANHAGYVYNPADRTKTTIREMTEERKDHMFVNNQQESGGYGYLVNKHDAVNQERDSTTTSYMGNSGNTSSTQNAMTYDSAYNAYLIDKAPISKGRAPSGNMGLFNNNTNMKIDRLDSDRNNNRMYVPQNITKASPDVQQLGRYSARSEYGQEIDCQRNAPEILNAFNSNPYSKPLNSVA
jgi:hypothetical protein